MPVIGRELMPLMDTGVMVVRYEAQPNTDDIEMARIAEQVEAAIKANVPADWVVSLSNVVGSEAGVKSLGQAQTLTRGSLTISLVDRFHRDRSQQQIQDSARRRLQRIPGLISGKSLRDALLESVHLRTRPILMTASASAVGMVPIALEWAVGVERLSTLGVDLVGAIRSELGLCTNATKHHVRRRPFRPLLAWSLCCSL